MFDVTSTIAPTLSALRSLPNWLLIGLALASYAVLFAPPFGGIEPEPFREEWGLWAWISGITFSILAVARVIDAGVAAYLTSAKERAARRLLRFVPLHGQCWWNLAKQQDDSFCSQICLDVQVANTTDHPVQIVNVQLDSPKAKLLQAHASLPMAGSPYHSPDHPIPPFGTVPASVHIMVQGALARAGKPLRVRLTFTDQYGEDYKLKGLVIESRDPPSPPCSIIQRLRRFIAHWSRPSKAAEPTMPWTFEPGGDYLTVCESVLEEERRCYAARGRNKGGLGSLSVRLQSGPNHGYTEVGKIPQLLWNEDDATPVTSPNLDRLIRVHKTLDDPEKDNLERYLMTHLQKSSPYSEIGYFVFLALHRMDRTIDALQTARTFLSEDKIFGYSNILGTLSAVVSHEHFNIDQNFYPQILDALSGDEEYDFKLRQKINVARLAYLDKADQMAREREQWEVREGRIVRVRSHTRRSGF